MIWVGRLRSGGVETGTRRTTPGDARRAVKREAVDGAREHADGEDEFVHVNLRGRDGLAMARVRFHGQKRKRRHQRLSEALRLEAKRFRLPLASSGVWRAFPRLGRCCYAILLVLEAGGGHNLTRLRQCWSLELAARAG